MLWQETYNRLLNSSSEKSTWINWKFGSLINVGRPFPFITTSSLKPVKDDLFLTDGWPSMLLGLSDDLLRGLIESLSLAVLSSFKVAAFRFMPCFFALAVVISDLASGSSFSVFFPFVLLPTAKAESPVESEGAGDGEGVVLDKLRAWIWGDSEVEEDSKGVAIGNVIVY